MSPTLSRSVLARQATPDLLGIPLEIRMEIYKHVLLDSRIELSRMPGEEYLDEMKGKKIPWDLDSEAYLTGRLPDVAVLCRNECTSRQSWVEGREMARIGI